MNRSLMLVAGALLFVAGSFLLLSGPVTPQPDVWHGVGERGFVLLGARLFDGERVRERMDVLVNAAFFEALVLRLRGFGTVQVLFFSGEGAPSIIAIRPVELSGDRALARVPLGEVSGLDRRRLHAIALVAAPAAGDQRFEISSVELR
jgi:hypothetical protein